MTQGFCPEHWKEEKYNGDVDPVGGVGLEGEDQKFNSEHFELVQ